MYPKKLSCSTKELNFTLSYFLYIWGGLALISLKESPDVLDCFGKGSTINGSWNSYCVCNWILKAELVKLILCSCHTTPALLYRNSGFARKKKTQQQENSSYAKFLTKFCLYADKLMCEKRKTFTSFYFHLKFVSITSAHEILFFQLVLSPNSWIWHYKALGNLQLQVPSQHSKSHWISASECDIDTCFSFITFPIQLCHCNYSNQMSSALPLSKCQWNMQTNPGTPSLPRLPILALLFLLDFSKYPYNRGTDKTKRCKTARDGQDIPLFTSSCVMGCWMLMEWISTYQHRSYVESVSLLGQDSLYKLV